LLRAAPGADVADHHEARVNTDADLDRLSSRLSSVSCFLPLDCLYNLQPRTHRPARIIFMCRRIAEVDQQPIAQILREVAIMALNNLATGLLILLHDRAVVFGIQLCRQCCRAHEVTEQHRELAALRFGCSRGRLGKRGR
jgi:hypothetical protein